jgi:hypothetical protein
MDDTDSQLVVIAAFARDTHVDYRDWPGVATHFLATGYDGQALAQLAGLDLGPFDAWDTDGLLPAILEELQAPPMDDNQALHIVAGCVARLAAIGELTDASAARILADLYIGHGYPREPEALSQVHCAEEFLDCDCHDPTSTLREALTELEANAPASVDVRLLVRLLGLRHPR